MFCTVMVLRLLYMHILIAGSILRGSTLAISLFTQIKSHRWNFKLAGHSGIQAANGQVYIRSINMIKGIWKKAEPVYQ